MIQAASEAIERIHSARELFSKEYTNLKEEASEQADLLEEQVHGHTDEQVRQI